ncbi:hypothetical protein AVEN_261989-1 [Araneus ventricosus]|uniref:Uncharacterized protein n=1 Tax=Araneus ventricosus TaxID=182803 RepID=A0A4Y2HCB5_ARAVE|nr:hypothetical protein AVEN_261989-1 [Araneus ventricosus]
MYCFRRPEQAKQRANWRLTQPALIAGRGRVIMLLIDTIMLTDRWESLHSPGFPSGARGALCFVLPQRYNKCYITLITGVTLKFAYTPHCSPYSTLHIPRFIVPADLRRQSKEQIEDELFLT